MKTAISVPDDVFGEAENLAARLRISRSDLYARALKEFLERHADQLTTSLDTLCSDIDSKPDEFLVRAARKVLRGTEW